MPTVETALRAAAARLEPVSGSGRLDALLLLEHVTGATREAFVREGERELTGAQAQAFASLVARRADGVPVAYLIGNAGFFGRAFAVDERVLVPRPETELLLEAALDDLRRRPRGARVADVGTGSGVLAVSLAAELPAVEVYGSDVSSEALAVARANAALHGVAQRCTFVAGDLTAPLRRFAPFDLVVANLPYVPTADIPATPDPVAFEPRLALDGGADGLALYRRLVAELPAVLAAGATVLLEAAPPTVGTLAGALARAFPHAAVSVGSDYGARERFVRLGVPVPAAS